MTLEPPSSCSGFIPESSILRARRSRSTVAASSAACAAAAVSSAATKSARSLAASASAIMARASIASSFVESTKPLVSLLLLKPLTPLSLRCATSARAVASMRRSFATC